MARQQRVSTLQRPQTSENDEAEHLERFLPSPAPSVSGQFAEQRRAPVTISPRPRRRVLFSQGCGYQAGDQAQSEGESALDQSLWTLIRTVSDAEAAFWALRNDNLRYRFVLRSQLRALLQDEASIETFLEQAQQPTETEKVTAEFILCWVPTRSGPAVMWQADYWQLIDERIRRRRRDYRLEERKTTSSALSRESAARDTRLRSADGTCWLRPLPCPPHVIRALSQGQEALVQQLQRSVRYGRMSLHQAELLRLPRTCFSARFHILAAVGAGALAIETRDAPGRDPFLCLPGLYATASGSLGELGG